ncbi:terminase large subunit domain-containing protein [Phocoenobacter uteri]|uniref:terminase large subunit domain-containing protein n=1 Tax=Phocoenobacter uteri TaxID=146806 RepID=UPI00244178E6|nr:terminase large subunit [Phocoenobacter uteri]
MKRQNIKLEPWQLFTISNVFGWVRKSDGLRKYRQVYTEIPRKNGKNISWCYICYVLMVSWGRSLFRSNNRKTSVGSISSCPFNV